MSNPIIITGATGFVGRHIVSQLAQNKNNDIYIITRNVASIKNYEWAGGVTIIEHDINNENIQFDVPPKASLIHLAWEGLPNFKDNFHYEKNLPASYNFIKSLIQLGVKKVLVTGTCFEYGMKNGPLSPDTNTAPENPYGFAKDCLRQSLEYLQKKLSFDLQWARLFYMYGEGQNPKSILAQLDTAIDNGDEIFNMSGGEQLRDYLHISDVAQQICDIFAKDTQGCFNVCSGNPISIYRLVNDHIEKRGATIKLNLGHYDYPDYEPMAFWGVKN